MALVRGSWGWSRCRCDFELRQPGAEPNTQRHRLGVAHLALVVRRERGSRGRLLQDLLLHVQTRRTVINSSPSTPAQCILCIMAFVGRRPDRWVGRALFGRSRAARREGRAQRGQVRRHGPCRARPGRTAAKQGLEGCGCCIWLRAGVCIRSSEFNSFDRRGLGLTYALTLFLGRVIPCSHRSLCLY